MRKCCFERMMKNYRDKEVLSQMVSPPVIGHADCPGRRIFLKSIPIFFASFGFEISAFGGREYAISAVPPQSVRDYDTRICLWRYWITWRR